MRNKFDNGWPETVTIRHYQRRVAEFMGAAGNELRNEPGLPSGGAVKSRILLMEEEAREFREALESGDLEKVAHELGDVLYVAIGTANTYGFDLEALLKEIHNSNMSKLAQGVTYKPDGKVAKTESYRPPNMKKALGI